MTNNAKNLFIKITYLESHEEIVYMFYRSVWSGRRAKPCKKQKAKNFESVTELDLSKYNITDIYGALSNEEITISQKDIPEIFSTFVSYFGLSEFEDYIMPEYDFRQIMKGDDDDKERSTCAECNDKLYVQLLNNYYACSKCYPEYSNKSLSKFELDEFLKVGEL